MLRRDFCFVALGEGSPVEILRVGEFVDMHGRDVSITEDMLDAFVANFEAGAAGQEIPFDIVHEKREAAGWLKKLWREGETLLGIPEWNSLGEQLIGDKIYQYLSATIDMVGQFIKTISLVNTPAVKGLKPVALAESVITWEKGTIGLGAYFQARIHLDFTRVADAMAMAGFVTPDERKELSGAIGAGLEAFAGDLGDVGEKVMEAPYFEPYVYYSEAEDEKGDVGMNEAEQRKRLRAEIRAELAAEMAENKKLETKLREEIRAEERALLEAEYARHGELVAFAEEVCRGENALSESPEEVIAFLSGLEGEQLEKAKALLRSKTVDLTERGSSGKGEGEGKLIPLNGFVQKQLRTYLDEGQGTVEEFFALNAEELGEAAQYDLAEFAEEK
jgi:hypothetical protein